MSNIPAIARCPCPVYFVHPVHFGKQLQSKLILFNLSRTVYMFFKSWYRNDYDVVSQNKIDP